MLETADILARNDVLKAILAMIKLACDNAGVSTANSQRISVGFVERLIDGEPLKPAIDLVDAIRDAIKDS